MNSYQEERKLKELTERFTDDPNQLSEEEKQYLHFRLRPAVMVMIEQENVPGLEQCAKMAWITAENIKDFIDIANRGQKPETLNYLLDYQYHHFPREDKNFEL